MRAGVRPEEETGVGVGVAPSERVDRFRAEVGNSGERRHPGSKFHRDVDPSHRRVTVRLSGTRAINVRLLRWAIRPRSLRRPVEPKGYGGAPSGRSHGPAPAIARRRRGRGGPRRGGGRDSTALAVEAFRTPPTEGPASTDTEVVEGLDRAGRRDGRGGRGGAPRAAFPRLLASARLALLCSAGRARNRHSSHRFDVRVHPELAAGVRRRVREHAAWLVRRARGDQHRRPRAGPEGIELDDPAVRGGPANGILNVRRVWGRPALLSERGGRDARHSPSDRVPAMGSECPGL